MNHFLIQLWATDPDKASWLVSDKGKPMVRHGNLNEAVAAAAGHPVVLLAPTENLVLTTTDLQIRQKAKLRKALPYALEEQLASDVEELHFALAPQRDEQQAVAIIEKSLLEKWLGAFQSQQIALRAIIPDVLSLPWRADDWSIACDSQRALVRTGRYSGFACDRENLAVLLDAALESEETPPINLRLWQCKDKQALAWPRKQPRLLKHRCDGELLQLLQLLAKSIDIRDSINLLQGDYGVQTDLLKSLKPWRWPAALALLLFTIGFAGKMLERNQLAAQQTLLRQQAEQIYRRTFPDARKVVNPRIQMAQRLKQLRGGGKKQQDRFLDLLATSGEVIAADKKARLKSIRYRNGRLDLKVTAPTLSKLDSLKNRLIEAGLNTELTNADSAGGKAVGNLRITRK